MKMYNKCDLEYTNGYLVFDGEIIPIDNEIVDLANKFERDSQLAEFKKKQDAVNESAKKFVIQDSEFKFESERTVPQAVPSTPLLDKKAEEAIKLMDELDDIAAAKAVNEYFSCMTPLLYFINDDVVVSCEGQVKQHRFDLPTLGNPLLWDYDFVCMTVNRLSAYL